MNRLIASKRAGLWAFLGILALVLTACAELKVQDPEQAVKQRVTERWEAVIANDWDRVYEFATPAYREAYSKTHFFNQYGGQVDREGIEITKLTFEDAEQTSAKVGLVLTFSTLGMTPGELYRGTQFIEETWVKVDGQWWYVERR